MSLIIEIHSVYVLIPGSRVFLEKLIFTLFVRNSLPFIEPETVLLCSQDPAIGHYLEPFESNQFPVSSDPF
jgi:hypothetical protein